VQICQTEISCHQNIKNLWCSLRAVLREAEQWIFLFDRCPFTTAKMSFYLSVCLRESRIYDMAVFRKRTVAARSLFSFPEPARRAAIFEVRKRRKPPSTYSPFCPVVVCILIRPLQFSLKQNIPCVNDGFQVFESFLCIFCIESCKALRSSEVGWTRTGRGQYSQNFF